jgi:hypothetical protein
MTHFTETAARRVDVFSAPPPRLYCVTEAQPTGRVAGYAVLAGCAVLLLTVGWVAGILSVVAVLP